MTDTCPTVRIVADNEQGFIIINETDFNPDVHALFGADDGYPSNDEMRSVIAENTGKAPHHKLSRAKLIEAYTLAMEG